MLLRPYSNRSICISHAARNCRSSRARREFERGSTRPHARGTVFATEWEDQDPLPQGQDRRLAVPRGTHSDDRARRPWVLASVSRTASYLMHCPSLDRHQWTRTRPNHVRRSARDQTAHRRLTPTASSHTNASRLPQELRCEWHRQDPITRWAHTEDPPNQSGTRRRG